VDGKRVDSFLFDGHELVYETHGTGPEVTVLLHGLLLDANLNRGLAQSLAVGDHRVVLLELLGHGRSDKPAHATAHRMDLYARQVIALLDHLELEQAVVGGTSLGANVALQAAAAAPGRVRGLLLEMPVLEWAGPACALVFVPLLLGARFGGPAAELLSRVARRVPRTGYGPVDALLSAASLRPRQTAAVLHGLLIGPTAPTATERREMRVPTLILGHERDAIHPFSDAENLARQMPNARLVRARSLLELRTRPTRLTSEISAFLDEVWEPRLAADRSTGS
jgi:pimeloyl-ACP methyl ester carboxylesterase